MRRNNADLSGEVTDPWAGTAGSRRVRAPWLAALLSVVALGCSACGGDGRLTRSQVIDQVHRSTGQMLVLGQGLSGSGVFDGLRPPGGLSDQFGNFSVLVARKGTDAQEAIDRLHSRSKLGAGGWWWRDSCARLPATLRRTLGSEDICALTATKQYATNVVLFYIKTGSRPVPSEAMTRLDEALAALAKKHT